MDARLFVVTVTVVDVDVDPEVLCGES